MNLKPERKHSSQPPAKSPHGAEKMVRVVTRILSFLALTIILACGGEPAGSGCDGPAADYIPPLSGIALATATQFFAKGDTTQGESFELPVQVNTLDAETPGGTVVITPAGGPNMTFDPATQTVTLGPEGSSVYTSFTATVGAGAIQGSQVISATRTAGEGGEPRPLPGQLGTSKEILVVDNLVSATITPASASVRRTRSQDFNISILPRGNTSGDVGLVIFNNPNVAGLTSVPNPLNVNLTAGSTTPVVRTITVSASQTAPLGSYSLNADVKGSGTLRREVARSTFTVIEDTGGDPTFSITANPTTITTPNGVVSTQSVLFTVASINGFTGPIKITWVVDGYLEPSPNTQDFILNIAPGAPKTFTRKFYRYTTDNQPIPITFNATDNPFTTTKSATVTVRVP